MITAHAVLRKAEANADQSGGRLDDERYKLIVQIYYRLLRTEYALMMPCRHPGLPSYLPTPEVVHGNKAWRGLHTLVSYAVRSHVREALFAHGAAALLLLFIGLHNAWSAVTHHVSSEYGNKRKPSLR